MPQTRGTMTDGSGTAAMRLVVLFPFTTGGAAISWEDVSGESALAGKEEACAGIAAPNSTGASKHWNRAFIILGGITGDIV